MNEYTTMYVHGVCNKIAMRLRVKWCNTVACKLYIFPKCKLLWKLKGYNNYNSREREREREMHIFHNGFIHSHPALKSELIQQNCYVAEHTHTYRLKIKENISTEQRSHGIKSKQTKKTGHKIYCSKETPLPYVVILSLAWPFPLPKRFCNTARAAKCGGRADGADCKKRMVICWNSINFCLCMHLTDSFSQCSELNWTKTKKYTRTNYIVGQWCRFDSVVHAYVWVYGWTFNRLHP